MIQRTRSTLRPLSAEDLVRMFAKRLKKKSKDVARIASVWNSFEGWLKYELVLALCAAGRRYAWSDQTEDGEWGSIGVEYRVPPDRRGVAQANRLIDLWVCGSKWESWHYVELKVAFENRNASKQIDSWRGDLKRLRAIEDRGCENRIVLLVAVGFDVTELRKWGRVNSICPAAGKGALATPAVGLVSQIA